MRPAPRRRLAVPIVALLAGLAVIPGRAQVRPESARSMVMQPADSPTGAPLPVEPPAGEIPATFADTMPRASGWLGNAVRLEVPRDAATGQYARPKFVVGVPSDSMKGWLGSAGLDAEHCMLPMLRARTRMSGDGEVSGTLWLYARCTFR